MLPDAPPSGPGPSGWRYTIVHAAERVRELVAYLRSSHPQMAELLACHDGELTPAQSRRVASHLRGCAECRHHSELKRWQIDRLASAASPESAPEPRRAQLQQLLRSIRPSQLTRPLSSLLIGQKAASHEAAWPAGNKVLKPIIAIVAIATLIHVLLGFVVWSGWHFHGSETWARALFDAEGDLFLVELAAVAFYLATQVRRGFSEREPMYEGWFLISTAFGCDLVGTFLSRLMTTHANSHWYHAPTPTVYQVGLFLGGPIRLAVLACGLFRILRVYNRAGITSFRLSALEYVVIGCLGSYTLCANIVGALDRSARHGWSLENFIQTSNDPLLLVVLVAALLLRRSVRNLGDKYLTRCWAAMVLAFGLIFCGNMITWAIKSSGLPEHVAEIGWDVLNIAAAGFPLACAFQLLAMRRTAESVLAGQPLAAAAASQAAFPNLCRRPHAG